MRDVASASHQRPVGRFDSRESVGDQIHVCRAAGTDQEGLAPRLGGERAGKPQQSGQELAHLVRFAQVLSGRRQTFEALDSHELELARVSENSAVYAPAVLDRADAAAPAGLPPFDKHSHRPRQAHGREMPGQVVDAGNTVDQAIDFQAWIRLERRGYRSDVGLADKLVRDQHAFNAGTRAYERLRGIGDRDSPRAPVELTAVDLRAHGRLSVWGEQESPAGAPARHRVQVMVEGRLLQHQER